LIDCLALIHDDMLHPHHLLLLTTKLFDVT
jgi:hypothetical protein